LITITIICKKKAEKFIAKESNENAICYYLDDDYTVFHNLQSRFGENIIKNLDGLFDESLSEIKESLLELSSRINKEHDSLEWWGGHIASRSNTATPLFRNIVYLFCAKKLLSNTKKDIIFLTESNALTDSIVLIAQKLGYNVFVQKGLGSVILINIRQYVINAAHVTFFLLKAIQNHLVLKSIVKPNRSFVNESKKRILIRSWITKGNVYSSGVFCDRNFGVLPEWLRSKGFEVLTLPMFFNMDITEHVFYKTIKDNEHFLIPEHYLKWIDYLRIIYDAIKLSRHHVCNAILMGIDISRLFNEIIRMRGICEYPFRLNLCYPLLKRLKEAGIGIDRFFYAFESNAPEKQFIIACRKFYPESQVTGYQHTVFLKNLLTYHLSPGEKYYHPLPDNIVCSGPIYLQLHKEAGFPPEIIFLGPSLRFTPGSLVSINDNKNTGGKRRLLLPLTFSYALAFDLLLKAKEVVSQTRNYELFIRSHPLLSDDILISFIKKIGLAGIQFANDGNFQFWLKNFYAVISTGASVTILEAISAGIPVIRVIPENTFFLDPFAWSKYPLKPVLTSEEIVNQLLQIEDLHFNKNVFHEIARCTRLQYFTEQNDETMKVFIQEKV